MYGQDSFFGGGGTTNTPQASTTMYPNPNYQGTRIVDRDDLFPRGFTRVELDAVYARLTQDVHDEGLILESPDLAEVEFYNPGVEPVPDDFILEAITVEHFSRTERRMAAVVKVLNRHLKESEITALPPVVGKPRKSGAYAYVIVQLPFSDGQTVNVVFHSPEGDKKKITANDTIIAFRWLLNKRDITHVVAPEEGEEVSLETIAKRVTQLVVKNSARFERQQKAAQAERKELDTTREAVKEAEGRQTELMDKVAGVAKEAESVEARLSNTLAQLEKQRTLNAELQAKIDALRAQRGQTGRGLNSGSTDPMVQAAELGRQAALAKKGDSPSDDKAMSELLQSQGMSTWTQLKAAWVKGYQEAQPMTATNTATAVKLHLPKTETRPEEIRVIFDEGRYLVQTCRDGGEWVTQKSHGSEAEAIKDAEHWYPDEKKPDPSSVTPDYIRDIQAVLDGAYDTDTGRILDLLEKAIEAAEKDGILEQYQSLLDAASNRLTDLLAKEAA